MFPEGHKLINQFKRLYVECTFKSRTWLNFGIYVFSSLTKTVNKSMRNLHVNYIHPCPD